MTVLLYILLATGEAAALPVPDHICRSVTSEIALGMPPTVELDDGRMVRIDAAACYAIVETDDPCEMEDS